MRKEVSIYNEENILLANATMEFTGPSDGILWPEVKILIKKLRDNSNIRFQVHEEYESIYDGVIKCKGDDKIYVEKIKNISSMLPRDLKIMFGYDTYIEGANGKRILVRVKDISSGGVRFVCKNDLNESLEYEIILPWTEEPLILNLKILRKSKVDKCMIYGCKFVNLIEEEERMVRESIYYYQKLKYRPRPAQVKGEVANVHFQKK